MSDSTPNPSQSGITRRGVIKAAAWSTPVIAAAVAAPLASASVEVPPKPGRLDASSELHESRENVHPRTVTFTAGTVTYEGGALGSNSGSITLTIFATDKYATWHLNTDARAAYEAAGWAFVTNSPLTFLHTPIPRGGVITTPEIRWVTSVDRKNKPKSKFEATIVSSNSEVGTDVIKVNRGGE